MAFLTLRYKCLPILALKRKITASEQITRTMRVLESKAGENAQFTDKHLACALHFLKERTVENEQITGTMRALKAKTVENKQVTGALRVIKQVTESERLHTALQTAKKRMEEVVIVEETPAEQTTSYTQEKLKEAWRALETAKLPRITHETLKSAWHSLETSKFPRVIPETPTKAQQSSTNEKKSRPTSNTPKSVWRTWQTGKLPLLTPEAFAATRHPLKTLKEERHDPATLIALVLTVLVLIALLTLGGIAGRTLYAIQTFGPAGLAQLNIVSQQIPALKASKALVRISQLDESEYASQSEYDIWAYSACSTTSMAEVFDAYGRHYRITDVLKVENAIGAITPQLGLLHDSGIARTAARFGFHTYWGEHWTLDQVLSYANAGEPVIVGWPPDRYPEGHIVVVTGGNAHTINIADSSLWDRQTLSRAQFMRWWVGFAAVVTPE